MNIKLQSSYRFFSAASPLAFYSNFHQRLQKVSDQLWWAVRSVIAMWTQLAELFKKCINCVRNEGKIRVYRRREVICGGEFRVLFRCLLNNKMYAESNALMILTSDEFVLICGLSRVNFTQFTCQNLRQQKTLKLTETMYFVFKVVEV